MRNYIYLFILNVLAILCIGSLIVCVVGAFVEYKTNLGANYIAGLIFFGVVSFLVVSFVIMWVLNSWYDLQRAVNRSK